MSGAKRREYIGEITIKLLDGNARKTEREFGWGRKTVKTGMAELTTGIRCLNNYSARGNKKTEEKMPELAYDIQSIVDPKSQADPKFQTPFLYTRITAKAVRQALIDEKGYTDDELPCENTIGDILKRIGYNWIFSLGSAIQRLRKSYLIPVILSGAPVCLGSHPHPQ